MKITNSRLQEPYADIVGPSSPVQQAQALLWDIFSKSPFPNNQSEDSRTAASAIMLHLLGAMKSIGLINAGGYHSSAITMLRAAEDALDCLAAVASSSEMAIQWYSGSLKASDAAKYWTKGNMLENDTPLGEYRKAIRCGLNAYCHCSPAQTNWNIYRHQTSSETFTLKQNYNHAVISTNGYYIDRYLCVHLYELIHVVLHLFSRHFSQEPDTKTMLIALQNSCKQVFEDFLKEINSDKLYMDTPPELDGIKPLPKQTNK